MASPAAAATAGGGGLTFDEALTRHVGQFGRGQRNIVALASSFWIPNACAFLIWMFLTLDPLAAKQWACADAGDAACAAAWASPESAGFCALAPEQWRWTSSDSLAARFSLVCGASWKVQLVNSLMFAGCFVGSGVFGGLADRLGRRLPLGIATAIVATATLASLAAPSYWWMAAARAVTGFGAAGQSQAIFLLCTEATGPSHRGLAAIASTLFFAAGEFLLLGLAYALPNWRHLTLTAGLLNAAALLLLPAVPESARWLLAKGRVSEAAALLRRLCSANGSSMPTEPLIARHSTPAGRTTSAASSEAWTDDASASSDDEGGGGSSSAEQPAGLLTLLCQPSLLARTLVLLLTWFSLLLVYYGIALGSGGLPGSIYVTFALGTAAELAAILVAGALVDRLGRHNLVSVGMLLGGAACLGCARARGRTAQAVLAAAGKFGCSAALAVCPTWTAELFPTPVRASAMGLFNQASRAGAITAPFLLMAATSAASSSAPGAPGGAATASLLPFFVYGVLSLLAGGLVVLMPETLGAPMPESVAEMQQLQTIFAAKPWRRGCWAAVAFVFNTHATLAPTTPTHDSISSRLEAGGKDAGAAKHYAARRAHDLCPAGPDEDSSEAGCGGDADDNTKASDAQVTIVVHAGRQT